MTRRAGLDVRALQVCVVSILCLFACDSVVALAGECHGTHAEAVAAFYREMARCRSTPGRKLRLDYLLCWDRADSAFAATLFSAINDTSISLATRASVFELVRYINPPGLWDFSVAYRESPDVALRWRAWSVLIDSLNQSLDRQSGAEACSWLAECRRVWGVQKTTTTRASEVRALPHPEESPAETLSAGSEVSVDDYVPPFYRIRIGEDSAYVDERCLEPVAGMGVLHELGILCHCTGAPRPRQLSSPCR